MRRVYRPKVMPPCVAEKPESFQTVSETRAQGTGGGGHVVHRPGSKRRGFDGKAAHKRVCPSHQGRNRRKEGIDRRSKESKDHLCSCLSTEEVEAPAGLPTRRRGVEHPIRARPGPRANTAKMRPQAARQVMTG